MYFAGLHGVASPHFRDLSTTERASLKRALTAERDRQQMPYDKRAYDQYKDSFMPGDHVPSRAAFRETRLGAEQRWDTGIQGIISKL